MSFTKLYRTLAMPSRICDETSLGEVESLPEQEPNLRSTYRVF
jgi:hypothetical protein